MQIRNLRTREFRGSLLFVVLIGGEYVHQRKENEGKPRLLDDDRKKVSPSIIWAIVQIYLLNLSRFRSYARIVDPRHQDIGKRYLDRCQLPVRKDGAATVVAHS